MEVSAEAKRIMVVALGKLYSSRTQRGGLRLHRSLLLTLVMKSARDMYHAAQAESEQQHLAEVTTEPEGVHPELQGASHGEQVQPADNKENQSPSGPAQHSRKRRGKAAVEPDFLPCKKAKLEQRNCPQQLCVNSVLVDYANCSSGLGASPAPVPLHRAIAAC